MATSFATYIKRQLHFYTTPQNAIRFAVPWVFFVIAASLGSFLLHVSTHRHITRYLQETAAGDKYALSPLRDLLSDSLAKISILKHVSDRTLDMMCLLPMGSFAALVEQKLIVQLDLRHLSS